MGYCTCDVSFAVETRVVLESELDGAPDDGLAVYDPVGFRYEHPIYAAWSAFTGSPVVFCCLGDKFNFFFAEPLTQISISAYYLSGISVVVAWLIIASSRFEKWFAAIKETIDEPAAEEETTVEEEGTEEVEDDDDDAIVGEVEP